MLDAVYYKESTKKIIATRERISIQLKKLGFIVLPSSANFLFVSKPGAAGAALKAYLEGCGIYVRQWNAPRISDYLRIAIGTDEQMDILVEKLRQYA
jgi:histidinol-phosphate aminotransferase